MRILERVEFWLIKQPSLECLIYIKCIKDYQRRHLLHKSKNWIWISLVSDHRSAFGVTTEGYMHWETHRLQVTLTHVQRDESLKQSLSIHLWFQIDVNQNDVFIYCQWHLAFKDLRLHSTTLGAPSGYCGSAMCLACEMGAFHGACSIDKGMGKPGLMHHLEPRAQPENRPD